MQNSNLAERLEDFAEVVNGVAPPQSRLPRILAAVVNTEKAPGPRPRPIPARRRIQIRDQGLHAFRVF